MNRPEEHIKHFH